MAFSLSILSDYVLFWVIQICIFIAFFISIGLYIKEKNSKGRGDVSVSVKRGDKSMAIFYGSYAFLNGLLVALCLSVEVIRSYRVFWVIIDTILPAYICLFNPWARNKIISWVHVLRNIEEKPQDF